MANEFRGVQRASSELDATTVTSYKCANCGNMFPIDQNGGTCNICGYHCSDDVCQIVSVSDEDY